MLVSVNVNMCLISHIHEERLASALLAEKFYFHLS